MAQVVVDEPLVERTDEWTVVRVSVAVPDGKQYKVWFRLPPVGVARQQCIDASFVIGRLVAMSGGWELRLPGPLSARLVDRAEMFQDVFLEWFPNRIKQIPLEFQVAEPLDLPPGRGAMSTFSGGIDSYFTALENTDKLAGLLFVHGLDFGLHHLEFRAKVQAELAAGADELGLPLWQVDTNVRRLTNPYASWGYKAHGSILSGIAILLAENVDTFYLPSTVPRGSTQGKGWGSHVLIDRHNSTDYLTVIHHGVDTKRPEKTARVARSESALRHLRVCFRSRTDYNCGRCSKCRRTIIDLNLAGITECDVFAEMVPLPEVLENFKISAMIPRAFAQATIAHAGSLGRRDVVVALRRAVARYDAEIVRKKAIALRSVLRDDPQFLAVFMPGSSKTAAPVGRARRLAGRIVSHLPPPARRALRSVRSRF